jgi:3-oxoadipate enol-lactonase
VPFAHRGSRRIYYEVHGPEDAPPLLLIMGMGFSSRAWGLLPAALGDRFRVAVFDNTGTGRSYQPRPVLKIRHMADDAAAVLDTAGIHRAFVFGISMGGMIALELTLRHPERVRALALGATYGGWWGSEKPSAGTLVDLLLGGLLARAGGLPRLSRILVSDDYLKNEREGFESWIRIAEHVPPRIAAGQAFAISLHAAEARLDAIEVPTLVITGDRDRLVPAENSRRLARMIPGARLLELSGAGHCFPLERPAETARALTEFFLG